MLQRYKISLIVVNLNKGKIINMLPYIRDCDFNVDLRTFIKKVTHYRLLMIISIYIVSLTILQL